MYQESTKPLMRPRQAEDAKEELRRLEGMMQAPPHIASQIQDIGEIRRQYQNLKRGLDQQAPKPYAEADIDIACAAETTLRTKILEGMPTQAEMRRNPAGARDKHMRWEKRNKEDILRWKNVRLRQHASGLLDELPEATDIANLERFRPQGGAQELNMHSEQIPGRIQHGPTPGAGPAVVFSDQETETLKVLDPELHDRLALMTNEHRALVKSMLRHLPGDSNIQPRPVTRTEPKTIPVGKLMEDVEVASYELTSGEFIGDPVPTSGEFVAPKKPKRKRQTRMKSPEERKAWGAKMKAARAAARAEREAKEG